MVTIKTINDFESLIQNEKVLVEFTAEWSTPCKMLDTTIEELEKEHAEVTYVKVDSDRFRNIARDYKVVSVPVVCLFSKGELINQRSGLMRKEELLELIQQF